MLFSLYLSRRRHTRCALVTGVQTCALPIWPVGLDGPHLRDCGRRKSFDDARVQRRLWVDRPRKFCPSQSVARQHTQPARLPIQGRHALAMLPGQRIGRREQTFLDDMNVIAQGLRSEEHTSELQSLMRISYAVFCLKTKNKKNN